jgi:hypothetical protein
MTTKSRPQRKKQKDSGATAGPLRLAGEVSTYEAHLPAWVDREGRFVLIKGQDVLGVYPRYEEAPEAGYDQLGSGPFLVKQILVHEPIYQLGHVRL